MAEFYKACENCHNRRKCCELSDNPQDQGSCKQCVKDNRLCVMVAKAPTTRRTIPAWASQMPPQQTAQPLSLGSSQPSGNAAPSRPTTQFSAGSPNTLVPPPSLSFSHSTPYGNLGNANLQGSFHQHQQPPPSLSFSPYAPYGGQRTANLQGSFHQHQQQQHSPPPLSESTNVRLYGSVAGDEDEWQRIPMTFTRIE